MAADKFQIFCDRCHTLMNCENFFRSKNETLHPDGFMHICKKCATSKIDPWNKETFLWLLEEIDVPYVPDEWEGSIVQGSKQPGGVVGSYVFGKYVSKMRLNRFNKYKFSDTALLQELKEMRIRASMEVQGRSEGEIAIEIEKERTKELERPEPAVESSENNPNLGAVFYADRLGIEPIDLAADLTDDDKRFLYMKWGKTYTPEEWVKLEQLYKEMEDSYEIEGAGHEDTLKFVCKTSLKANQLLDIGDVDGAQKMIKMYNDLMRSGKFTASQNKQEKGEYLNSISEMVALCEAEGFIPRYYTAQPNDMVDETLRDFQTYVRNLVMGEINLGNLIEGAVRALAQEESKQEDADDEDKELTYDDFVEFREFEESAKEEDE